MWKWLLILACCCLNACGPSDKAHLLDYRALGELRVAIRQDTLSFQPGLDGKPRGFEHDLLLALGERLGVPIKLVVMPSMASTLQAIERGDVHLAAAGLVRSDKLRARWSAPLRQADYILVGHVEGPGLERIEDLQGRRVGVRPGSVAAQPLQALRQRFPELKLSFAQIGGEAGMLERVARRELDFAAADALGFEIISNYHPELRKAWPLGLRADVVWAISADAPEALSAEVDAFIAESRQNGLIDRIAERYFGHVQRLADGQVVSFLERVRSHLPRFRELFREAAMPLGLDWRLLAALAYQESQWDALATSPTGVRGMMMLTEETASRLGVRDRLDPRQSIFAGARYLAMLRKDLPDEVDEPDRSWMAVAAYNIGLGHLRGAQAIARRLRRDHTSWMEMKRVLPLIGDPEYAARLKAGAGRGGEAVIMTESVRNYYDILTRFEPITPEEAVSAGTAQGSSNSSPPM